MRENLYLNLVGSECQITNKVNKERKTQTLFSRKKILEQIYVYGSLLEGKQHQSLAKPDKIKLKRTMLAKQIHGVNTIHANLCVTFDISFVTSLKTVLLFLNKTYFVEHSI